MEAAKCLAGLGGVGRWSWPVCVPLVILAALAQGQGENSVAEVVRAKRIELVDENGKPRAVLCLIPTESGSNRGCESVQLALSAKGGERVLSFTVWDDGMSMAQFQVPGREQNLSMVCGAGIGPWVAMDGEGDKQILLDCSTRPNPCIVLSKPGKRVFEIPKE